MELTNALSAVGVILGAGLIAILLDMLPLNLGRNPVRPQLGQLGLGHCFISGSAIEPSDALLMAMVNSLGLVVGPLYSRHGQLILISSKSR